ncbi:M23 family metallopeptidase [Yoonia litorea]|uniref:Murein DD-endopeptidase MepM and murein hydrolase activator NlpD, contain LysM domain n=1 Tax=Yoonia litorea TaxID=1123755 RepID=A0A1I6MCR5_9RHOB|nr:M23 family metallopeptidase [Yoonia litorea]SFS13550.1 Murein DD-endopeptidase MepM and murein hydrolase activator NlpD, contain LysM domain [Yoonia litorea]
MAIGQRPIKRVLISSVAVLALAACEDFDFDLRDIGNGFDTSSAVQSLPGRPRPDDRGVISYPNYQVVVARQNDTIRGIAIRLGLDAQTLADYNGIDPDVVLRQGEIVALPARVAEPSPATGAISTGPIQPLDVTAIATSALDRADADAASGTVTATPAPAPQPQASVQRGTEPIRHQVVRGETVFSLARLYNVPVTAIAEWNGLDSEFTIREGQFLLIPQGGAPAPATVSAPGAGSETPVPPSAATPLPDPAAAAPAVIATATPDAPDLGQASTPAASDARFSMPLQGAIIRDYAPGSNEGIDIGAAAGSDVRAAGSGTVAAVTTDTSGGGIVVIKHSDGLLTVYTQLADLTVAKDDSVSQGQVIAKVRSGNPSFLHFEVRRGLQSLDPSDYLP